MAGNRQKPYFSGEQLDKLEAVFRDSMDAERQKVSEGLVAAVRSYAQSPKHAYENALLYGVIEGYYRFVVKDGQATWQTRKPHVMTDEAQETFDAAEDRLKVAIQLIARFGSKSAGKIDYEELPAFPLGMLPPEVVAIPTQV